ncbi:MAG: hypothetical protein RLZZ230_820 [Candidatus Parcubacteria bacterium]
MFNLTAILGPVFFLGGLGWMLDMHFDTGKKFLFVAIAISFVLTHVLMFKKIMRFMRISNQHIKEADFKATQAKDLQTNTDAKE